MCTEYFALPKMFIEFGPPHIRNVMADDDGRAQFCVCVCVRVIKCSELESGHLSRIEICERFCINTRAECKFEHYFQATTIYVFWAYEVAAKIPAHYQSYFLAQILSRNCEAN